MTTRSGKAADGARMKAEDLWARLAGSPELRPATPSIVSSLPIHDRHDQELTDADMDAGEASGGLPMLESVVHLHELPSQFAFAYFERDGGCADIQTPSGHVVANERPVVPRVVLADRVVWEPVVASDELTGHRFRFMVADEPQGHVEAFVDATSVRRVLFAHKNYSLAGRAAGLVDRGALVEYVSPTTHFHGLRAALAALRGDQFYTPTREVAIGTAMHPEFGAPLHIHQRHARNPTAAVAAAVWLRVRQEADAIWEVARAAAEAHNASELGRTGLS
jgi:hypothetical protein